MLRDKTIICNAQLNQRWQKKKKKASGNKNRNQL